MKNSILNQIMTPGMENYLKALIRLSGGVGVQSSDVADALGVTKGSVSCMMNRLRDEGYITKERYGLVSLTEKGRKEAAGITRRYNLIQSFFVRILGVDAATAAEDACRIEHIISPQSIDRIDEKLEEAERNRDVTPIRS